MATYGGSSDPNPTKKATFKTSDNELVKVPVAIASMFGIVKNFFDGNLDDLELENTEYWPWYIKNVSSYILNIVVYACKKLLELFWKYHGVKKERRKFDVEFFDQRTDETIVELVEAAVYLGIEELLDFVMPSFRKKFGLGDDKGVEFIFTVEFETILQSRAASAF